MQEQPKHILNLGVLLLLGALFHGTLVPFTQGGTYDAYIHMFFGQHYAANWFDPWEPRWYTGFSTTSYPPATHMVQAIFQQFLSIRASFTATMVMGILILIVGFYRFAILWVSDRAALIASLLLIFSSSIVETIHIFGQLPTIFSLGIFLNGMPFVFRWVSKGTWIDLVFAMLMAAATTSAHHVTTIFGSLFFVGALCLHAWVQHINDSKTRIFKSKWRKWFHWTFPIWRGGILGFLMVSAIAITVFPYWYWSFTDPITQVSIPHGTRESFLDRPDLGLVFFIIPWGMVLFFFPYIAYKTLFSRLWPLGMMTFICFVLGTGGTTPIPKMMLGPAFDILTLDRFTFWGSILCLPFLGLMFEGLFYGKSGEILAAAFGKRMRELLVGGALASFAIISTSIATMSTYKSLQPPTIDPASIVSFMSTDEHYKWRYLTLGFGDQFAYISAQMDALSVDGNYHSARRLPEMMNYSVERLENAKYLGVAGVGSLQQFLVESNRYSLKYVFSNDAFYDPVLYFSGWRKLLRLPNNIVVWEKLNVDPLPLIVPRKNIPFIHRVMWGVVPITALGIGLIIIIWSAIRLPARREAHSRRKITLTHKEFKNAKRVRYIVICLGVAFAVFTIYSVVASYRKIVAQPSAERVIENYYKALDFRQFAKAYEMLDPDLRPSYDGYYFERMWQGGLVNSYGKFEDLGLTETDSSETLKAFDVRVRYLTALGTYFQDVAVETIKRDGKWYILPKPLQAQQTTERVQQLETLTWQAVGRRQPRAESDIYRDKPDRPEFGITNARIVKYKDRFSVVGVLSNLDVDPMAVTIQSLLMDENVDELVRATAGLRSPHRLMPHETSGFRVDFEGVLSLEDALNKKQFDPDFYLPPELDGAPTEGRILASSVVADEGIYRSYVMTQIEIQEVGDGIEISGQLQNTGLENIAVSKILIGFYDMDGKILWTEIGFTENVLRPGKTAPFKVKAPKSSDIEVVQDISGPQIDINLNLPNVTEVIPDASQSTIPMNGLGGYQSARIYVDPLIFDQEF